MWRDRTGLYISYRQSYAHHPTKPTRNVGASGAARHESTDEEAQGLISGGGYDDGGDTVIEMDVLPPRWLDIQDEVTEKLKDVEITMKKLDQLHQKHVLPGFDDDAVKAKESKDIDALTQRITRDFQTCQSCIRRIAAMVREAKQQNSLKDGEETMADNLRIALASRVAQSSGVFRKRQTAYLKKMRVLGGFDSVPDRPLPAQAAFLDPSVAETENDRASAQSTILQTQQKQRRTGAMDAVISQREREIEQIAQGVIDLANIFQDINAMVIDQGTMLDRIDYNVERTSTNMKKADKELVTASGYQKRSTKRKIILLLILIVIGMIILVTLKPKRHGKSGPAPDSGLDMGIVQRGLDVSGHHGTHIHPTRDWRRRRRRQPVIDRTYISFAT